MTRCLSVNVGSWIVMQALDLEGGSGDKVLHIECISSSKPNVQYEGFFLSLLETLASECQYV